MGDSQDFTDRELRLMSYAWLCFDDQPKIDYDKLASFVGMTNSGSARNAWAVIKKKLAVKAAQSAGGGDENAGPSGPKATPRRRGRKATDEAQESPAKKAKGRKGKATAVHSEPQDDDDDAAAEGSEGETAGMVKKERTHESEGEEYEV